MVLVVQSVFDNPQTPGDFAQGYFPDQLMAGGAAVISQPIVLAAGTLPRGSVLGQQTQISVIAVPGTNTGNGTVGSFVYEANREFGAFVLTATGATTFSVVDPEGVALPNATVGTAYVNSEIGFTIMAGGTAFVAGDSFVLNQVQATGNYILSVRTANDGSQTPAAILADYADASLGAVKAGAYLFGEFNQNALNYDNSWNLPQLVAAMRPLGLFAKFALTASNPS